MDIQLKLQQLEERKASLLDQCSLAHRKSSGTLPASIAQANFSLVLELLDNASTDGMLQSDPEIQEFYTDFIERSSEGLVTCLEREIDLLDLAVTTGDDQMGDVGFGMEQAAFPVRVGTEVVHVIVSGKYRTNRVSAEDLHSLSELSGQSLIEVQNAASMLPILSRSQAQVNLDLYRILRDSIEQILDQCAMVSSAQHQLLQSEKTRSLGTLSGGLAHHFNNLLSVVLGYSSFILSRGDHPEEIAEALKKIGEAAQKGRRLTQEILAFSGGEQEENKPCNVHDTLDSVLSLIESELRSATRVERKLEAGATTITAPPSAVRQLVFNLLNNAVDSMPDGGLLTVESSNVTLEDKDKGSIQYLKISVQDTGSGSSPESVGEDSMPLSNVYGMVSRLDGTVMVRPGTTGTRVEVLLPVGAVETPEQETIPSTQDLGPSTIWVVDDDPIFLEMCSQVLGEEGHAVVPLDSGDALKEKWAAKDREPDLIVTDFIMPECNGRELAEWLQEQGATSPMILVSGFSENQPDIRAALQIKKTFFLQKPFTSRDLLDAITVALGEKLLS